MTRLENEDRVVTVLPITHTPPLELSFAVEIPYSTKQRLGLDAERSWVMLSEANRFVWPGPDLRPLRGADVASIAYGMLPYRLMEDIRMKFIAHIKARRAKLVSRTEYGAAMSPRRVDCSSDFEIFAEPDFEPAMAAAPPMKSRSRTKTDSAVSMLRPRV